MKKSQIGTNLNAFLVAILSIQLEYHNLISFIRSYITTKSLQLINHNALTLHLCQTC